ncbi:MAG: type II toxin-antitoxin system RelE/ParE family toxin [Reichenbachiella sp.]|uniref:type II toxin-antitoxin system RelE/ParE family toxin n=1 Tax=Reichenbachiella sp. TaxID=2184521 RepID=UPI002967398F|nr:type II toxin-antitoxin system RelE/ParE family toxin [Reichenbachiella sp.]MDW3208368.1 type II toxin-antitoxin system RelE/ParE family toxin [Reichenbachiella sp.]
MALQIIWSPLAQQKRKTILNYWIERNSSVDYSRKLNALFVQAANQLSKFPKIGRLSDVKGVRIKIVRDYLLFYEITDKAIEILTIWDSRQDPDELKLG